MLVATFGGLYETIFNSAERHIGVVLLMSGTVLRQDESWREIANRYAITVSVHSIALTTELETMWSGSSGLELESYNRER
jgi:hypothetical protein